MGNLVDAVTLSIADIEISPRDDALIELVMKYAHMIDLCPDALPKVGPLLLSALEALTLTPRSRAALVKGVNDDQRQALSPLDELRARRAARGG